MTTPLIPAPYSYSKLSDYEKCPRQAMYKYADGIERYIVPKPPAMQRGIEVHRDGELWMRNPAKNAPVPGLYAPFADELRQLKRQGALPEVTIYLDQQWQKVPRRDQAMLVMKLDLHVVANFEGRVIDYKTGRPYESHKAQAQLYALGLFACDPRIAKVTSEMWYLDVPEIRDIQLRRANVPGLTKTYTKRISIMAEDREFKPRPGRPCAWCDFSAKKGGPCTAG